MARERVERIEVPRTARYACLGGDGGERGIGEIWYVLHGYAQLATDFLRPFRTLASPERLVVAPEGLSRFYLAPMDRTHGERDRIGASWMTRDDRDAEIRDYVRYLDRLREHVEAPLPRTGIRRVVLGFSQGCHTAARWLALGEAAPDALVLWGASLPADPTMDVMGPALQSPRLVLVRGEGDPHRHRDKEEDEERRLQAAGIPFEVRMHPKDHRIHRVTLERLADELR